MDNLDVLLKDKKVSKHKVDLVRNNLTKLAMQVQKVPPQSEIKDEKKS